MIEDSKVQESIKAGLMAYKGMAKWYLRGRGGRGASKSWSRLPLKEKVAVARALVKMEAVAKSPKDFFSKEATEADWRERAEKYAAQNNCSVYHAYLIILGPKEYVINSVYMALQQPLRHRYENFLAAIQDYEYSHDNSKELRAKKIIEEAERICEQYDIVSSKGIVKLCKQIKYDFTR